MDGTVCVLMCIYFWLKTVTCTLTLSAETIPDNTNRCLTEVFLSEIHEFNGKITIEDSLSCELIQIRVVSDDEIYDRILYYFNDLDPTDCTSGVLKDIQVNGNGTICSENGVFETEENELNLSFSSELLTNSSSTTNNRSHIELSFTLFHKGRCESYDFPCEGGRCIYHALSCSGDNPCGDHSDCKISIPAIITLCLGGVCVLGVVGVILFIVCKTCLCCSCGRGRREWAPRKFSPVLNEKLPK